MSRSVAALAAAAVVLGACDHGRDPGPGQQPKQPTPAHLTFMYTSPWTATAGGVLPSIDVRVVDENWHQVTVPVEVTLTDSTGTLAGTTTRVSESGVARFNDLILTRAGNTKLFASAPGVPATESPLVTIVPAEAVSLELDAQLPATMIAGSTLPDVTVVARDAYGNRATSAYFAVTLSVQGGALLGTTSRSLDAGAATFPGLAVREAGVGYKLTADGAALPSVESTPFDVTPATASRLAFGVQPTSTAAGDILTPSVEVRVEDAFGNLVPEAREVTIGPSTEVHGTSTVMAIGGIATFPDLSLRSAGTKTITAAAAGLTSATSAPFVVAPGMPASLQLSVQPPVSLYAGASMPTVSVEALDAYANRCTNRSGEMIGLSLDGAELIGTTSRALASGLANFSDLSVRKAGTGYQLSAVGVGLGPVKSRAFDVMPGAAHHLAFTTQPPPVSVAGATFAPSVQVATLDAYDNVTPATGSVTLSLSSPVPGAALLGTTTASLVAGTATFGDLSLRTAAAGYRLNATRSYLPVATSEPFTIVAAGAAKLAFLVQPTSIRSGQAIAPPVQVAITDEWLNVATTTAAADVTLVLEANAEGAVLAGTTTVATSAGVATFPGLTVREPANGYRVRATAWGFSDAVSGTFNVTPNWISVGPDGGDITALATDPGASDVAYAATNGCVWKTVNGGLNWARACLGLVFPMQIEALVVHPSSSNKLFAAGSRGLYRSDDAGASWSAVASLGAGAPYRMLSVAVAASGSIYAGTFADGLWRSDDGGATWTRLTAGLPSSRITAIAIEPASTEVLYAAAVDPDEVGTVYRSTDRGNTWNETALGPAAFPGVKPTALLVDPSSANIIFAGTQSGVYESYDRGATFAQGLPDADVRDVAAHGPSHVRFAAGTTGVWRKVGFDPWAASTTLPPSPNTIAVAVRANGTALAGTRYGVYDRTTYATTWSPRTTGLRALNVAAVGSGRRNGATYVYAATLGGGIYRSLDGGATWMRGNHPAEGQTFYGVAVERADAQKAWLAGSSGLYRTTDAGVTWSEVFTAQGAMYSTILDSSSDAIIYAGGTSDVYRSSNSGGSFRDLNVCAGPTRAMALSAAAPLALWVGQDAGVCKVDLSGVDKTNVPYTWQAETSGIVDAIAVDPDTALAGSRVWASTSTGFHTTVDGGATWTKTDDRFNALLAQPGKLFGARFMGALEMSRDGGLTFSPAGVGLYYGNVRAIADVPGLANEIYAATSWGSVFKTTSGGE